MLNRVTLAVTLVLVGCGVESSSRDESSGAPEVMVTSAEELTESAIRNDGIIVGNALSTRALMFNALSTNYAANDALTQNPLTSATFSSVTVLREALEDPAAREFFGYMVGCALSGSTSVSWTSSANVTHTFKGQAGLCGEWQKLSAGARVSSGCQELVSACILARNNAYGFHVPLSVRGDDSAGGPTLAAGLKFGAYDWRDRSRTVSSLEACGSSSHGVSRNCGFRPGHVRACTPGATVTVAAGAPSEARCNVDPPLGAVTSGDMVLRACEGLAACDSGTPELLDASEGYECPNYLYKPTLNFTCPPSGLFNVMEAPYASEFSGSVELGELGSAPALEQDQFAVREGAFFGNIFVPESLAYEVTYNKGQQLITPISGGKVVYKSMHTCADAAWERSADYAWTRVCTSGYCAAHSIGVCQSKCGVDSTGDGEFRTCWDDSSSSSWSFGLTTFLHHACDLRPSGDPKSCNRW
ncbi:MAG: hypothetical protein JXB05_06580 [Myxococcaceae bacterium]|nr:hypothetical protein [Myxococcaceae bacterium]